jgi:hypothetical protein
MLNNLQPGTRPTTKTATAVAGAIAVRNRAELPSRKGRAGRAQIHLPAVDQTTGIETGTGTEMTTVPSDGSHERPVRAVPGKTTGAHRFAVGP